MTSSSLSWTIIDGGLATELIKMGFQLDQNPLWSASLLYSNTAPIVQVHKMYINAGSQVITSASYQASIEGYKKHLKITSSESEALIEKSVHLCQQARDENPQVKDILIAGSVGPYGVALADGSEYNGNYADNMSLEELITWHRLKISCLVRAGCDLLAFETIPCMKEGVALIQLLREFPGVKAWLSFSCQHPTETAHKENFSDVVKSCLQLKTAEQLVAIGVNCCPPDYVESLAQLAARHAKTLPIIAYPNSGEAFTSGIGWKGEPKPLQDYVKAWVQAGVQCFGGCCRTTPNDIELIKKRLSERNPCTE